MTVRATALVAGVLMVAALGLWPRADPVPATARPAPPGPPPSLRVARDPVPVPARNPFEFEGAEATAHPASPIGAPAPEPSSAPEPQEEPVHLVGLLLRGGHPVAALSIFGSVEVAGAGETVLGYTVLAVDPEQGVRLRGPDGETLSLPSPAGDLPEGP